MLYEVITDAGAVQEDPDQLGLAHFVEHMAFNGTANFAKHEIVDYMERIGMQFGPDVNAYTSFDETPLQPQEHERVGFPDPNMFDINRNNFV